LGLRQGGDVPEGDVRAAVDWIETALAGVNAKRLRNVRKTTLTSSAILASSARRLGR